MITAKNIHKYYDNLHVLKGVNLQIKQSEIVSIVGASGAGKTTLLQILGTLDFPDKSNDASLEINGENIVLMKDKALSKFRNTHYRVRPFVQVGQKLQPQTGLVV